MIKSDKHDYSEPLCDNAQLTARDNVCYLDMSAFQDRLDFILRVHCIFLVTSLREGLIVSVLLEVNTK